MYNNWYGQQHGTQQHGTQQHGSQHQGAGGSSAPSWVSQAGYQTDRTGFGFKPQSGAAVLASLDDKVADADEKLRDFMAEIESMDTEETAADASQALSKSKMAGFVSGGHVLPASDQANNAKDLEDEEEGEPLIEPTTTWQHLMDQNTKHYYYWNTVSNEVTWTIPADYTEYLVRHKLYREALAAGRKTMPVSKSKENILQPKSVESQLKPQEPEPVATEIGPQLPPDLMKKSESKETTPPVQKSTPKATAISSLVGGYESSESEDEAESTTVPQPKSTIKSLVAYDDSFANDGYEAAAAEPPVVQGPQLPPSAATHRPEPVQQGPELPLPSANNTLSASVNIPSTLSTNGHELPPDGNGTPTKRVNRPPPRPPSDHDHNSSKSIVFNGEDNKPENQSHGHNDYVEQYGDFTEQMDTYDNDTPLDFGPAKLKSVYDESTASQYGAANHNIGYGYDEADVDAPLSFRPDPVILTAPPPPPPEEDDDNSHGLSSVEISEYSSVIMDKLHFLDVHDDDLSKLQTILIQLKTRLDDWQAGGLSKQYLIEKIQETDGLLEVCESESSPAGWRCNWSRKEKQYYYIHEITDELSWTYPDEDVEAMKKLAEQKSKQKKGKKTAAGTLAQLSQAIEVITVDSGLKTLFLEKIMEKCTPNSDKEAGDESKSSGPVEEETASDKVVSSPVIVSPVVASPAKRNQREEGELSPARPKPKAYADYESPDVLKSKHRSKSHSHTSQSKKLSQSRDSSKAKPHERSRPKAYEEPEDTQERSRSKDRSRPRAFDDRRHSKERSRSKEKIKSRTNEYRDEKFKDKKHEGHSYKSTKRHHSDSEESSRANESSNKKSKHKRKHDSTDKKHKKHSKRKKSSKSSKSSKEKKHRSRSNSSGDSSSKEEIDLTRSPDASEEKTIAKQEEEIVKEIPINDVVGQDIDAKDKVDMPALDQGVPCLDSGPQSEDEMDISPLPSPLPPVVSSSEPGSQSNLHTMKMNEAQPTAPIDNISQFQENDEQDIINKNKPVRKPISIVRPPPPRPPSPPAPPTHVSECEATIKTAPVINSAPPPPPPPAEDSTLDEFYKEVELELAEKHSTSSAPVLYSKDAEIIPSQPHISCVNAPVLYTAQPPTNSMTDNVALAPTVAVGAATQGSPVRFPADTQPQPPPQPAAEASKPVKDKHHKTHKKSSKKGSKMPAALVQKWQKVQSEITTDMMNEKRLKDELLK